MKIFAGDIIILHMCTKTHIHFLRYGVRQNFLSFWAIFCHFTPPPDDPENQNFQKKKMPGDIILSYTHVYHKGKSYDIWFLKYKVKQTEICHFVLFFALSALTNQKIKILKLIKTPGDIIILHICTINGYHMMYGSRDMEHDRQKFLSFWTMFCPFTPNGPRKLKFCKNENNT